MDYSFYIGVCERFKDLCVAEQIIDWNTGKFVDVEVYQYDPTRFRALYEYAHTRYHTYGSEDTESMIQLRYPDKIWVLRRRVN